MTRTTLAAAALLLAAATPLAAQPSAQSSAQAPAPPPRPATTWEVIDQPMSALLNGGHRIVSAAGPSFTLERDGKYVSCEVRPAGGMGGRRETVSECRRLN